MPMIKRRHVLQMGSSALAALGLSQWDIMQQGDRVARVLAQNTPRKLALLVGINTYPEIPLFGCINDILAQRELLIHRYGFNPKDIAMLPNAQATRQGILTAFEEHLIKQAKPGDVVVFHYSGHGSRVVDLPECDSVVLKASKSCENGTLVPYDYDRLPASLKPTEYTNEIMGHTLFLLMAALKTENITVVLDSCFSGGGTRGNFLIRSRLREDMEVFPKPIPDEKAYQDRWLTRLKLSKADYIKQRRIGVAKGVVIAGAQRDQVAADAPFAGFRAGAFSYTLTRYLWQLASREGIAESLVRVNLSAKTQATLSGIDQDPLVEYKPGSEKVLKESPFLLINPVSPAAEAVVTKVNGKKFTCWLGGIDPQTLDAFDADSLFTIVGQADSEVKFTGRRGLEADGEVLKGKIEPGSLLQESVRGLPTDLALEIALDPSLGEELPAIEQALKKNSRLKVFSAGQGGHFVLGRLTNEYRERLIAKKVDQLPEVNSIGLFSPGLDQIVRGSFGISGESGVAAATRLKSKFTSLLAGRLLKLSLNSNVSKVAVDVKVVPIQGQRSGQIIAGARTIRGEGSQRSGSSSQPAPVTLETTAFEQVKPGEKIELRITNRQRKELYIAVLAIDSSGDMTVLFPSSDWSAPTDAALVAPNETLTIPSPNDDFEFTIEPPSGPIEIITLCSASSLRKSLRVFEQVAKQQDVQRGALPLGDDAVNAVEGLLRNVDENTRGSISTKLRTDRRVVGANELAALVVTMQVVTD